MFFSVITDSEAYRKIANTCMDKNYIYKCMGIFFNDGIIVANGKWTKRDACKDFLHKNK